jgi:diketogulonate reductase-like aldo/keto reductase
MTRQAIMAGSRVHPWREFNEGPHIVPIPGTTNAIRLAENLAAAEPDLSAADLERIAEVAPSGVAAGGRYDETGMRSVNG